MKTIIKVIIVLAMMCVGVQGYAQHYRPMPRHHYPHHVYHRPYYYGYYHYVPYSAYRWYPSYRYYYYSPLSLYLYDSYDRPSKIKVDCIEFKRTSSGRLRIKNGTEPKMYLDMYKDNHLRYSCPSGVKVDVETGDGDAQITVYGADGKTTAQYTL